MDKKISPVNLIAQIVEQVLVAEAERLNKLNEKVSDELDSCGDTPNDRLAELQFKYAEISGAVEQMRRLENEILAAFTLPAATTWH